MKNLLYLSFILVFFCSCNDGDIIVTNFDFEDVSLQNCRTTGNYVFFKIKTNPAESISLRIATTDSIFNVADTLTFQLNGTTNVVNYREYDGTITNAYFCPVVPPSSPSVLTEFTGNSGTAILLSSVILDDNDTMEEPINDDDLDNDGIPNYYDFDDDGDNVPTSIEIGPDPANPKDTDSDGIPDYLDMDDDGDGVPTINEDLNGDLNPANDITDANVGADYLNPAIQINTPIAAYREHTYTQQTDIRFSLSDLVLVNGEEEIIVQTLDLGSILNVQIITIEVTPEF